MYAPTHDTAILLFSRSAVEEASVKPLAGPAAVCRAVARQLICHARSVARDAGCPFFFFPTTQQPDATFGERLANAYEYVFSKGFSKVIAIGNDCPSLTAHDLRRAVEQLATLPFVLGPATDGGAYLIGMHQKVYQRTPLVAIAWQTDQVFDGLYALTNGLCYTLPEKSDVDGPHDLAQQLRHGTVYKLLKVKILQLIYLYFPVHFLQEIPITKVALLRCRSLRAPPSYAP